MTRTIAALGVALIGTTAWAPSAPRATLAGSVTGTITFTGTPPKMKPIDMAKEPSCAKQHATPIETETVVTGPNNALQYVVVYVSAGDQGSETPTTPVHLEQKGCQYIPHVVVMHAGQSLEIANNDQTSHNIHPLPTKNPEWNKSQPPGSPPIVTKYDNPDFIPVKCNVHPWMHGYHIVLATSHFGLSGNDGTYTITGLPPGKYTLTAWHEKFGTMTQDVTVGAQPTKADFQFKATPY
ncbi:MAG TPA: carboxypeptidase regulatory-like domain-containing protein [Gemmatimonadaceae bacterium]|jgi:plastocyanin|nr:carboxypeptidase regulatory-like domain-containing protein [Gemmatimonadaceae bacterium]